MLRFSLVRRVRACVSFVTAPSERAVMRARLYKLAERTSRDGESERAWAFWQRWALSCTSPSANSRIWSGLVKVDFYFRKVPLSSKFFWTEKVSWYLNVWWSQAEKPLNIGLSHVLFPFIKLARMWHFLKITNSFYKTTSNHTEFTPGLMHESDKTSKMLNKQIK